MEVRSPASRWNPGRWPRGATTILACGLLLQGCGDAGSSSRVAVDTVRGVPRVVTTGPGTWTEAEAWSVGGPILRLGTVEGEGPEAFGDVRSLTVAADGRVFVADGQALEVRAFGPDGAFLRSIGGEGEGPGEFRAVDAVEVGPEGTLLVRDPRLSRISRFDPATGAFLDSFDLERSFMLYSDGTTLWTDGEGRVWDQVLLNLRIGEPNRYAIVRYTPVGNVVDTLHLGEQSSRMALVVDQEGTPRAGLRIPFTPTPSFDVGPAGRVGWGVGDDYTITVRSPEGDTLRSFGRPLEPERVGTGRADAARASLRERASEMTDAGRLEAYDLPDRVPLFDDVVADRAGHWWVRRFTWTPPDRGSGESGEPAEALEPARWDVFAPDGRFLGTVETPRRSRIMEIGRDVVAGIEQDRLGVEYVAVYELVKP